MIFRSVIATVLTISLAAAASADRIQPLDLVWAAIAGALWLSLAIDRKEQQ